MKQARTWDDTQKEEMIGETNTTTWVKEIINC